MNPLILWRLKKFCDEHELDYQEIDDTLNYWENLEHLKSLVPDTELDMEDRWRAEIERYMDYRTEHFLQYYIDAARRGETKSKDVGPPIKSAGGFSLAAYIQGIKHDRN